MGVGITTLIIVIIRLRRVRDDLTVSYEYIPFISSLPLSPSPLRFAHMSFVASLLGMILSVSISFL